MPATPAISKRTLLIAAMLLGQLVTLLAALGVYSRWLESGLADVMRDRTLAVNERIAEQVAAALNTLGPPSLEPPASDAARLARSLVESLRLPHGAILGVIDADTAQVVCRSRAEQDEPNRADDDELHAAALLAAAAPIGQWQRQSDGSWALAAYQFSDPGARLVIHQPQAGFHIALQAFIERMRLIGVLVAAGLVALGAGLNLVILRAYDNRVASINERLERAVARRSRDVVRSRDAVIFGLAMLAEQRDGETGEHLERITAYTEILARQFTASHAQYDEYWVHTLRVTSALHDIGKVAVPDAVLRKPDSLTDDERKIIQQHPYIGGDTLLELKRRWGEDLFLNTAAQICLGHHEKWDGSGYPFGLKGEEIPLPARIVALADVYDALTSRRHYKQPLSHSTARQMIVEASGRQFDPQVVEAFLACQTQFEKIAFHPRREITEPAASPPQVPPNTLAV